MWLNNWRYGNLVIDLLKRFTAFRLEHLAPTAIDAITTTTITMFDNLGTAASRRRIRRRRGRSVARTGTHLLYSATSDSGHKSSKRSKFGAPRAVKVFSSRKLPTVAPEAIATGAKSPQERKATRFVLPSQLLLVLRLLRQLHELSYPQCLRAARA